MENILELKNITKRFGPLTANNNISLEVKKGTVHAIVGENGAGKSTLMNIVTDIHKPDSGEIYVRGQKVKFKSPSDANAHGIGMVHQEFMLFSELPVLENIMMGFEKKKLGVFIDRKKVRKEVKEICEKYNFNIPFDELVKGQPVSMLQQIEIVKVLYKGADIIIFDEPTSVLTPQGIEGLFNAIRFLVEKGKTILFITHKLKEVMEISDYVTVLKNGEVVDTVPTDQVNEAKLASMMVGRDVLLTVKRIEKEEGDMILNVSDLHVKDKDGNIKVKGVNFNVRAGEIVGIAGIAGSGQRELVEALYGLRKAEKGTISFSGQDITNTNCRERRCMGIGYVPQDRMSAGVNKEGTVWENCIMGYHIAHGFKNRLFVDKKQALGFTKTVIDDFSVKAPSEEIRIKALSGGNIQKVIVGREFLQKNRLLVIEDPTRGIDIGAIEFIWKKIISMAADGVGILLVSHELNEVMELSDRILVIYDGQLSDGGSYRELSKQSIGLLMAGGKLDRKEIS